MDTKLFFPCLCLHVFQDVYQIRKHKHENYWSGMRLPLHRCSTKWLWREADGLDTPLTPQLTEHKHVAVGKEIWKVVELGDDFSDVISVFPEADFQAT